MSWVERMKVRMTKEFKGNGLTGNGLAGWLMAKLRRQNAQSPRMAVLERISLGPRQTLAMVEADGRRILVATSPEGAAAFYSLDEVRGGARTSRTAGRSSERVSW
jgi:flagellar biogenesis protein FliO